MLRHDGEREMEFVRELPSKVERSAGDVKNGSKFVWFFTNSYPKR
jgi:hypothetical protein